MSDSNPTQTDDAQALLGLETTARAEVLLPADAHVIGEPVAVIQIRYPGLPRAGLVAACRRGELTYELSLADVVFPAGSAGASVVARYRTWLGLAPFAARGPDTARPHKVEGDDIVVGKPVDLVVLACKSNALRCRLLGSAREVTLRTAVRDEIHGSIITVTPKKQWTHARHPYLSGDVSSVRIEPKSASTRARTQRPTSCSTRCLRSTFAASTRTPCSANAIFRAGPRSHSTTSSWA
jgi:hypothetical protein